MNENNSSNTYPFTRKQLEYFRQELKEAGDFDSLMLKKEALTKMKDGSCDLISHENIDTYKRKHLNEIYKPLRSHFNTSIPFHFWLGMYEVMERVFSEETE